MDLTNILNGRDGAGEKAKEGVQLQISTSQAQALHPAFMAKAGNQSPDAHSSDAHSAPHSAVIPPQHMMLQEGYMSQDAGYQQGMGISRGPGRPCSGDPTAKPYPCSDCGKGFARRSDLARHERIHSGIRPHVCEYAGCEKQFIQRSALTVHLRVHTGEKPHMCETCGKPFSDSSSLARHRRIHSGKRPYKCPYPNCQKTFTRKTTLTRHQNQHTETITEAAEALAASRAAHPPQPISRARPVKMNEGEDGVPQLSSPHSTPPPQQRASSLSPSAELQGALSGNRNGDAAFWRNGNGGLPPHSAPYATGELQPLTPRSTPTSTPTIPTSLVPRSSAPNRSQPTSHPSYQTSLPPILEPPANSNSRPGSPHLSGSPHLPGSPRPGGSPHHPGSPHLIGSPHFAGSGYQSPRGTGSPADFEMFHNSMHQNFSSVSSFQNSFSARPQSSGGFHS